LDFQLKKRGSRQAGIAPEFTQLGDKIIGSAPWGSPDDRHQERFMVFTVRDGKIVDMQGCRSRREAMRFARRPHRSHGRPPR
jgi:hypothetical protein